MKWWGWRHWWKSWGIETVLALAGAAVVGVMTWWAQ